MTLKGYELASGVSTIDSQSAIIEFDEDKQLVGVFGLETTIGNASLNSLGFIKFEIACDITSPAVPPGVMETDESSGIDEKSIFYIILYIVLLVILTALIIIVCMLRRKEAARATHKKAI